MWWRRYFILQVQLHFFTLMEVINLTADIDTDAVGNNFDFRSLIGFLFYFFNTIDDSTKHGKKSLKQEFNSFGL